jgi:hypothetical protein
MGKTFKFKDLMVNVLPLCAVGPTPIVCNGEPTCAAGRARACAHRARPHATAHRTTARSASLAAVSPLPVAARHTWPRYASADRTRGHASAHRTRPHASARHTRARYAARRSRPQDASAHRTRFRVAAYARSRLQPAARSLAAGAPWFRLAIPSSKSQRSQP